MALSAHRRRQLLEYAAWQRSDEGVAMDDAAYRFADALIHDQDTGFLCDMERCGDIAESLAMDGTVVR
jgi:hypothetical protein